MLLPAPNAPTWPGMVMISADPHLTQWRAAFIPVLVVTVRTAASLHRNRAAMLAHGRRSALTPTSTSGRRHNARRERCCRPARAFRRAAAAGAGAAAGLGLPAGIHLR